MSLYVARKGVLKYVERKKPITRTAYKTKSCIQEQGRRFKVREILVKKSALLLSLDLLYHQSLNKIWKDENCSSVVEWVIQGSKMRKWDKKTEVFISFQNWWFWNMNRKILQSILLSFLRHKFFQMWPMYYGTTFIFEEY